MVLFTFLKLNVFFCLFLKHFHFQMNKAERQRCTNRESCDSPTCAMTHCTRCSSSWTDISSSLIQHSISGCREDPLSSVSLPPSDATPPLVSVASHRLLTQVFFCCCFSFHSDIPFKGIFLFHFCQSNQFEAKRFQRQQQICSVDESCDATPRCVTRVSLSIISFLFRWIRKETSQKRSNEVTAKHAERWKVQFSLKLM